jgi:hypothetical protein
MRYLVSVFDDNTGSGTPAEMAAIGALPVADHRRENRMTARSPNTAVIPAAQASETPT